MTKRQKMFIEIGKIFAGDVKPKWFVTGICGSIYCMTDELNISGSFYRAFKPRDSDWYWWPLTLEGDEQRVLFCCFMAAMSDKDYEGMVNA